MDVEFDHLTLVGNSQYGGCGYDSELTCFESGNTWITRTSSTAGNLYKVTSSAHHLSMPIVCPCLRNF